MLANVSQNAQTVSVVVSALIIRKNFHSAVFDSPKVMDLLEQMLRGIDRQHLKAA